MAGIYKIINLIDNKVYIGQSINIKCRFDSHKSNLKNNHHSNIYLQNAWNKYGEENFKFEILEECTENKLDEREQYWLNFYGGLNSDNNYNFREPLSPGRMSIISRKRMSLARLGKKREKWVCEKLSQSFKGRISYFKGKHLSEEHKRKISESNKGKKQSLEHINNARLARINNGSYEKLKTNKVRSKKISNALMGRKLSAETKNNISKSITLWWKEKKENGGSSNN